MLYIHLKFYIIKLKYFVLNKGNNNIILTSKQGKDWHQVGLKTTPLTIQVSALPSRLLTPLLSLSSYPRAYWFRSMTFTFVTAICRSTQFSTSAHLFCTSARHLHGTSAASFTHDGTYHQLNFSLDVY